VPEQLLIPGLIEFDPEEVEAVAQSWVVTELPHLHLLARRLRGLALRPKEIQLWVSPRVCVCRCQVPRPMDRAEARVWSRCVAGVLRGLGHHIRAKDVAVAWASRHYMTAAFAPTLTEQPGRLVVDLRTGCERVETWESAEFENDGRLL
jgi:hypothetical protein